ncbi:MAG: hypothetical protein AVDCRST_MAG73-1303 [uncultured Thermomicrobiales bacterium]|uniref:Glycosyltransferase RgtA/B/C/D-like domain-containing protein n=1 Tax=uncultured Thermomicrobiales bacterium TaxID=1645740 RepID=A0A6J4U0H4_9BACT|nr:MAG: hypothetical protein AVDCRST_MAG73-1303 [uncultured Thermomicrobiales bacterium]
MIGTPRRPKPKPAPPATRADPVLRRPIDVPAAANGTGGVGSGQEVPSVAEFAAMREELVGLRADVAQLRRVVRSGNQSGAVEATVPAVAAIAEAPSSLGRGARLRALADWPAVQGAGPREGLAGHWAAVERARWAVAARRPMAAAESLPLRWEVALALAILVVGAVLRFDDLVTVPRGLHGDEAIAGMEGQRILDQGWIGPYSVDARGQPSGPLYLTAASVAVFGKTVFAVRVVSAVAATLTLIALYWMLRRHAGARTALAGTAILAVMSWHLHYAHIGFPLATWPLITVLATGALLEAIRNGDWRWWAAAGALAGLGIYSYNAHLVFLPILGVVAAYALFRWTVLGVGAALGLVALAPNALTVLLLAASIVWLLLDRRLVERSVLLRASAFGAALVVVGLPMALYAFDEANGYLNHARSVSIRESPAWNDLDSGAAKLDFLIDRYRAYWTRLWSGGRMDGVDASGGTRYVPPSIIWLAIIGVVLGCWLRRGPLVWLGVLVLLAMPIAAVMTVDGDGRRTFVMVPFIAAFAGLAIIEALRVAASWRRWATLPVAAVLVVMVWLGVDQNLDDFRTALADSPGADWVFAREIAEASRFMADRSPAEHVYFYAARWSVNYETRQFLAPDVSAEDRSDEFGDFSLAADPSKGDPVFVFLGPYQESLPEVERLYPGGQTILGDDMDGRPSFVAYVPDPATVRGPAPVVLDPGLVVDPTPAAEPRRG